MSTYVMSDFHGRHDLFMRMLGKISFSDDDMLYILGDVVDRGPDGIRTFLYIKDKPNIVFLVGNHEMLFLSAVKRMLMMGTKDPEKLLNTQEFLLWVYNGGIPTWNAFILLDRNTRNEILAYIGNGYLVIPDVTVNGRHFYLCHATHADTYVDKPILFKDAGGDLKQHVVWDRVYPRHTHMSGEFDHADYSELYNKYPKNTTMVFGHTPTALFGHTAPDGWGRIWHGGHGHLIDIDCGCAVRDPKMAMLGCLRLDDMAEFYVHG
ncbi:MAG: metallophosphoesterase [Lachnospiraceae bacterium]|nr:metallophosphoesterase [Lachnospiraceae bacterium]